MCVYRQVATSETAKSSLKPRVEMKKQLTDHPEVSASSLKILLDIANADVYVESVEMGITISSGGKVQMGPKLENKFTQVYDECIELRKLKTTIEYNERFVNVFLKKELSGKSSHIIHSVIEYASENESLELCKDHIKRDLSSKKRQTLIDGKNPVTDHTEDNCLKDESREIHSNEREFRRQEQNGTSNKTDEYVEVIINQKGNEIVAQDKLSEEYPSIIREEKRYSMPSSLSAKESDSSIEESIQISDVSNASILVIKTVKISNNEKVNEIVADDTPRETFPSTIHQGKEKNPAISDLFANESDSNIEKKNSKFGCQQIFKSGDEVW